jgi:hypothetical protein
MKSQLFFFHQQFSRASYIASVTHLMDIEKPNTGTQPVKLSRRFFPFAHLND